jgi:hypothetical protein
MLEFLSKILKYFLAPPGAHYAIVIIAVLAFLLIWKRKSILREIKRWRTKALQAGPLTFERQDEHTTKKSSVVFGSGSDFKRAKVSNVAGRDISQSKRLDLKNGEEGSSGIEFGEKSNFKDAEIQNIAGRDIDNSSDSVENSSSSGESS